MAKVRATFSARGGRGVSSESICLRQTPHPLYPFAVRGWYAQIRQVRYLGSTDDRHDAT